MYVVVQQNISDHVIIVKSRLKFTQIQKRQLIKAAAKMGPHQENSE
jgi:hypothetical protein